MKKNQRREMRGRCREQIESKGKGGECRFRVRKHFIYTCFFKKSGGLVEPVRFNLFQTLKTEPEIFCNFLIG